LLKNFPTGFPCIPSSYGTDSKCFNAQSKLTAAVLVKKCKVGHNETFILFSRNSPEIDEMDLIENVRYNDNERYNGETEA